MAKVQLDRSLAISFNFRIWRTFFDHITNRSLFYLSVNRARPQLLAKSINIWQSSLSSAADSLMECTLFQNTFAGTCVVSIVNPKLLIVIFAICFLHESFSWMKNSNKQS